MRRLLPILAALVLLAMPSLALGHAQLIRSTPQAESPGNASPAAVRMEFSEAVTLLKPTDMEVVNENGESVTAGAAKVTTDNVRAVEVPLAPELPDGTYTVRYRVVSADSHIIPGAYAFGVGPGAVKPPNLGGATSEGPSMTGPWSVSARFFELVCLGGLLGLTAFRWLVWAPAWRSRWTRDLPRATREAGLGWGRDAYWTAFGILAVSAMVAETYLLVVYSAAALGTGVADALTNTTGISTVLSTTRLGSLVQLRGALLFGLFAVGIWQFLAEFGGQQGEKPPEATGPRLPSAVMAGLVVAVLYGIATQGHASQAPWPRVQVAADLAHMVAASTWAAGLAVLWSSLRALRTRMRSGGDRAGTAVLVEFSRVAQWAVAMIVATGIVRSVGELSSVEQLWDTRYGVVLMVKVGLFALVGIFALRNRRIVNTVTRRPQPSAAALAMVRRTLMAEVIGSLVVVAVAALLVAEVPGRI